MARYLIRRLLQAIPTFFGITLLSYALMSLSGNPVSQLTFRPGVKPEEIARLEAKFGVNDPFMVQYLRWLAGDDWMRWDSDGDGVSDKSILIALDVDGDGIAEPPGTQRGVLRGDFGFSFIKKRPVIDLLAERALPTLELSIVSFIIGTSIGVSVGVLAAIYHKGWFDQLSRVLAVGLTAIPVFWFALVLLLFFSVQLKILPIGDRCAMTLDASCPPIWERLQYMVLPVFVLSIGGVAGYSRIMRASMLDIISQDFIRTAQSKGLSSRRVWFIHAARNAMIPIATSIGPAVLSLLSGAVITETIFNYPGLGLTSTQAAISRDYPVVMALTIYAAVTTILGYLLSDILYVIIDPRIRFLTSEADVAERTAADVIRLNEERDRNHKSMSINQRALSRVWRDKLTLTALIILGTISLLVLFAGPICEYILKVDPNDTNPSIRLLAPFQDPAHILGTDDLGRDYAARLMFGGQVSLAIGFFGSIITLVIGAAIGLISGYFGGLIDDLFNWVITTLDSIPSIYLLLLLSSILTRSAFALVLVISLTGWTGDARLVRGQTIQIRNLDYVLSARALGAGAWRIMWAHIFPNTLSLQFLVLASGIGGLILTESTLSFLKLGVQPPTATWGNMLTNAQQFFSRGPHMATMSGLLIFVTVLCLYVIGDGLRDAFDPRTVD